MTRAQKTIGTILISGILLFSGVVIDSVKAIEWHTADSTVIAWDAVAAGADEAAKYSVFIVNDKTDPEKANPITIQEGLERTSVTITYNLEGDWIFGVATERWILGDPNDPEDPDEMVGLSSVSWSDNPDVVQDGNTFGGRYYKPYDQPVGLRKQ